ncbi:aldehyde dehydrogenase [Streptomyces phaeofaciens JCM 4814]|uniref:Aldehyde dehydrogenase n=1 Tax=Streptomyces phaeofaciens TaxID=68254 RepID=A0A918H2S3_9ACTN|nr:aldehyde dehydrogenase family protein [Streptomyces phaeofaciens]GGT32925.1 aldehyde dehydrogenase [Streptomyces phaeofaciens]
MSSLQGRGTDGHRAPAAQGGLLDAKAPGDGPEDAAGVRAAEAVGAADRAFASWSAMAPAERSAVFLQAAHLLLRRTDKIVDVMAAEVGARAPWAAFQTKLAAQLMIEAAASVTRPNGRVTPTETPGACSLRLRVPVGVVAAITPWTASVLLGVRAVALPLALGDTVVLKPSESTPLSGGLLLQEVWEEAGLPHGVLSVVTHGPDEAADVTRRLVTDPRVRAVSFTGSTAVGRAVGVEAARHLKPAVLELGGKNSLLVLQDADVDHAVDTAIVGSFLNAGQSCLSTDRIIVHRSLADRFLAALAERVPALPRQGPGWPAEADGRIVHAGTAQRVSALVTDALAKGATAVTGTGAVEGNGTLIAPVVLTGLTPRMAMWSEEIFGPAVAVHVTDSTDEAVALASGPPRGLTAGVVTGDWATGVAVARRLPADAVHVNNRSITDGLQAPFGGIHESGFGRFGSSAGTDAFTEPRWITLGAEGRPAFPL